MASEMRQTPRVEDIEENLEALQLSQTEQSEKKYPMFDDRYKIIEQLVGVSGSFNQGIYIVQDEQTKNILLCKTLKAGEGEVEKDLLSRLNYHPNITSFADFCLAKSNVAKDGYSYEEVGSRDNGWHTDPHSYEGETSHVDDGDDDHLFKEADWQKQNDRLYVEYCDLGTLADVIKRYKKASMSVPEGFIWRAFEDLTSAVQHCHYGALDLSSDKSRQWDTIIHRDIIPSNIFLASTDSKDPIYPRVVLGDFGCAVTESEVEELDRVGGHDSVPLQDDHFHDPTNYGSFDKSSDVYQVGLNIWCLCHNHLEPDHDQLNDQNSWPYSQELSRVLSLCISPDLGNRPTADELGKVIVAAKEKLGDTLPRIGLLDIS